MCMDVSEAAWRRRIDNSSLDEEERIRLVQFIRALLVTMLREKPLRPLSFVRRCLEEKAQAKGLGCWEVPSNYDYTAPTYAAHKMLGRVVSGPFADIRSKLDFEYHGNYTLERQAFQDVLIKNITQSASPKEHPWLVFTAGAMGAGKSHTIRWMSDNGYFPLPDIVQIDPDRFKEQLPEWEGYLRANNLSAGSMVHRESGYLVEIAQEEALRQKKNAWVDGSLRDGEWYSAQFEKIKKEHPEYRIAILHVYTDLDTVIARAEERGKTTGRHVPIREIEDSFTRVPLVVETLAGYVDFIAHILNDPQEDPLLQEYCSAEGCILNVAGDWGEVRSRFATHADVRRESLEDYSAQVDEMLGEHRLVVFTKSYCSYCEKLLSFLNSLELSYHTIELDSLPGGGVGLQLELGKRTGIRTVPLLFYKSQLIGTCDTVLKLHATHGLPTILREAERIAEARAGSSTPTITTPLLMADLPSFSEVAS